MVSISHILDDIIQPDDGNFSPELAQYILGLRFSDAQVARYEDLADRVQDGQLNPAEKSELEAFVLSNTFLMILQSKARRSLIEHSKVA